MAGAVMRYRELVKARRWSGWIRDGRDEAGFEADSCGSRIVTRDDKGTGGR